MVNWKYVLNFFLPCLLYLPAFVCCRTHFPSRLSLYPSFPFSQIITETNALSIFLLKAVSIIVSS